MPSDENGVTVGQDPEDLAWYVEIDGKFVSGHYTQEDADGIADVLRQAIAAAVQAEREACIRDACLHCRGDTPPYQREPIGPNSAGNYVHEPVAANRGRGGVLCRAGGIRSRSLWEAAKIRQRGET